MLSLVLLSALVANLPGVVAAVSPFLVLAQTAAPAATASAVEAPWLTLLNFGTLGLLTAGLLLGWIIPRWSVEEYRKRITDLEAEVTSKENENRQLRSSFEEKVIPLLYEATNVLTAQQEKRTDAS